MTAKKVIVLVSALVCMAGIFFCSTFDNPIDPQGPNYVGDENAKDTIGPVVTLTGFIDSSTVDQDSIYLHGTALDANGIKSLTVNTIPATIDMQGNWHLYFPLSAGGNTITIRAIDTSIHNNQTVLARYVIRTTLPKAPSDISVTQTGPVIVVRWNDNSSNESAFIIQRSSGTSSNFVTIDSTGPNMVEFADASTFTSYTVYYYRVKAKNSSGESQPATSFIVYQQPTGDSLPPAISFAYPHDGDTLNQNSVEVTANISDATSGIASVTINGVDASNVSGKWTATIALTQQGAHIITIVATDNSSRHNQGTSQISVIYNPAAVDVSGPVIVFNTPSSDHATVATSQPQIKLDVSDPSSVDTVAISGSQMSLVSGNERNGTYSITLQNLVIGENKFFIAAVDSLGNRSRDTLYLIYDPYVTDTDTPTIVISDPQANTHFTASTITVQGTAVDQTSGIQSVKVNGNTMSFNATTGSWTCSFTLLHGSTTITVEAQDNSPAANKGHAAISVVQNLPPQFTVTRSHMEKSIIKGITFKDTIHAIDSDDGQPLLSLVSSGLQGIVQLNDSVYTYISTIACIDTIRSVATDQWGDAVSSWWLVIVNDPSAGNQPPRFTDVGHDTSIAVGATYYKQVTAVDPNAGDIITYSIVAGPAGLAVGASDGIISWGPAQTDVGSKILTIRASDNLLSVDTQWTITVIAANQAPHAVPHVLDTAIDENQSIGLFITVTDPDSQQVNLSEWRIIPSAAGATFAFKGNGRWQLNWTPGFTNAGNYTVFAKFKDAGNPLMYDSSVISLTVRNVNRPPMFDQAFVFPSNMAPNQNYSAVLTCFDPDGDSLRYTAVQRPAGMALTPTDTGTIINWTTSAVGNFQVMLTVNDSKGGFDTVSGTVVVSSVNQPPFFASDLKTTDTAFVNQSFTKYYSITDPEQATITAAILSGAPSNVSASYDAVYKAVKVVWTPNGTQMGAFSLLITGADPLGLSDSLTLDIFVRIPNRAPVFDSNDVPKLMAIAGVQYCDTIQCSDPDGDVLTVTRISGPANWTATLVNFTGGGLGVEVKFTTSTSGIQTVKMSIQDPSSASATTQWNVNVQRPITSVSKLGNVIPGQSPTALYADSMGYIVAGTMSNFAYKSTNNGNSWAQILNSTGMSDIGDIGINGTILFFGAGLGATTYGICSMEKSSSTAVDKSGSYGKQGPLSVFYSVPGSPFTFAGHPASPSILRATNTAVFDQVATGYAGQGEIAGFGFNAADSMLFTKGALGPVYTMKITATSGWQQAFSGGVLSDTAFCYALSRTNKQHFAGTANGLYRWEPSLQAWKIVPGLQTFPISHLHVAWATGHIFVGSSIAKQVWTSLDNGNTWARISNAPSLAIGDITTDEAGNLYIIFSDGAVYKGLR